MKQAGLDLGSLNTKLVVLLKAYVILTLFDGRVATENAFEERN